MNYKLSKYLFPVLIVLLYSGCSEKPESETPLKIWFEEPTTRWNEGLPVGNGSLGGMIYGLPVKEQVTLNEETIWTGEKLYDRDKKDGHKYIGQIQRKSWLGKSYWPNAFLPEPLPTRCWPICGLKAPGLTVLKITGGNWI